MMHCTVTIGLVAVLVTARFVSPASLASPTHKGPSLQFEAEADRQADTISVLYTATKGQHSSGPTAATHRW